MNKGKRMVIAFAVLAVIASALLFFMSTTLIHPVEVRGNTYHTRDQILSMVGLSDTSTVLDLLIHPGTLILDTGYIRSIEVSKLDLKTVKLDVTEKEIIGYVEYMGKYICIDNRGYIVDYTQTLQPEKPKIKGIELANFTLDEPLNVSDAIVVSIDSIYRNAIAFDVPVDWIDFDFGQGNRISLYIRNLEMKIGDVSRLEEKFEAIKQVIQVLPEEKNGVLYIENIDDDIIFKSSE